MLIYTWRCKVLILIPEFFVVFLTKPCDNDYSFLVCVTIYILNVQFQTWFCNFYTFFIHILNELSWFFTIFKLIFESMAFHLPFSKLCFNFFLGSTSFLFYPTWTITIFLFITINWRSVDFWRTTQLSFN